MGLHNKPKESIKVDLSFLRSFSKAFKAIDPKTIFAVRIILSVVFIALCLFLDLGNFMYYFLLVLATVILGYDIVEDLINEVASGKYYTIHTILVLVSVLGFIVGMAHEVALMLLIYQIFIPITAYVEKSVNKFAVSLLGSFDGETREAFKAKAENKDFNLPVCGQVEKNTKAVLTVAFAVAIAYVCLTPLITNINFKESLYRAIIALLITTPASVIAAIPLTGIVGAAFAQSKGIRFNKGENLENIFFARNIVFDKEGIFTSSNPTVAAVSTAVPTIDNNTFITFAAHAVYYSEQWFAKPISDCYNGDYQLELISDFQDIPGYGVNLKINGTAVELGISQYFSSRNITIHDQRAEEGFIELYVVIAGRYAGKIIIRRDSNKVAKELIGNLKACNGAKAELLSDTSDEAAQDLAFEYGFDNVLTVSSQEQKLEAVNSFGTAHTLYVYSEGIEQHSPAGTDIRIAAKSKFADVIISDLNSLVTCFNISDRVNELVSTTSTIAFAIKALVIFLAFTGNCSLWFAVLLDSLAQIITMSIATRVPDESILKEIKSKNNK